MIIFEYEDEIFVRTFDEQRERRERGIKMITDNPQGLFVPNDKSYRISITFAFDGRIFDSDVFGKMHSELAPFFYLAYKARRGDDAAKMVLEAAKIVIKDEEGVNYWPWNGQNKKRTDKLPGDPVRFSGRN